MKERHHFSLENYNTFGFDSRAEHFYSVATEEELLQVLQKTSLTSLFILGGGSNTLLPDQLKKTVVHIDLKGKKILDETENEVLVEAMAGENWNDFVQWCVAHDFGGLENLSLIPGNVGTSPIQNIGAYGVELKDTFVKCKVINLEILQSEIFSKADCKFGYRNSIFKQEAKGKYIITSVVFRLTKGNHQLQTDYGSILEELSGNEIKDPTIKNIADAVIKIRKSKLPDPKKIGNSGSFFKNPIVSEKQFQELQSKNPEMPFYKLSSSEVKIPAGWLIDQAGFKGYRENQVGVHEKQALVLVNYGGGTGEDILALAHKIQQKIKQLFGVSLEKEVNVVQND